MDFKSFYKQLTDGKLSALTLISGDEIYLIDNLIKYITENFLMPAYSDFNLTFVESNTDMDQVLQTGITLPFFDSRRLIIFNKTGFLKSAKEEQEEKLLQFLKNIPEYTTLIFYENDVDKRKKLYKYLSKEAEQVVVERLTRPELNKWILKKFASYQKEISQHALNYLIEMLNYLEPEANKNLYDVDNAIRMLAGNSIAIDEKLINQYIEVPIEHNIFKMMDAISSRQMLEAIKILNYFVSNGEPEIKIFFLISQQFRNMYKCKILLNEGHTSQTIAAKLDIHPFVAKKAGSFSTQFSEKQLLAILDILEQTDLLMKSSGVDALVLIEKALYQISIVPK